MNEEQEFRLGLLNSPDDKGVIITIVHKDKEQGSMAYLSWEDAKMLADRIYAKYKKHKS